MPIFYDHSEIRGLLISGELDLIGIENLKKDKTAVCHINSVTQSCPTL